MLQAVWKILLLKWYSILWNNVFGFRKPFKPLQKQRLLPQSTLSSCPLKTTAGLCPFCLVAALSSYALFGANWFWVFHKFFKLLCFCFCFSLLANAFITFCECESFFFILQIGIPLSERIKYMYNEKTLMHIWSLCSQQTAAVQNVKILRRYLWRLAAKKATWNSSGEKDICLICMLTILFIWARGWSMTKLTF